MRHRSFRISCILYTLSVFCILLCVPMIVLGLERNDTEKAEQAKNLIVIVKGKNKLGAGIIFNKRGEKLFIATANHLVERGVEWIEFRFLGGTKIPVNLLTSSKPLDLAILGIDLKEQLLRNRVKTSLSFRQVGYSTALKSQDTVYPVGHPGGFNWYVPISLPPKIYKIVEEEITIDYKSSPGHSGGGLFNDHWDLVGMLRKTGAFTSEALSFKRMLKSIESWNFEVSLRLKEKSVVSDPTLYIPPHSTNSGITASDSKKLLEYLKE